MESSFAPQVFLILIAFLGVLYYFFSIKADRKSAVKYAEKRKKIVEAEERKRKEAHAKHLRDIVHEEVHKKIGPPD